MIGPIDRRGFLTAASASIVAGKAGPARSARKTDFALALGGGAARGLAHIPVLEALDELGVVPSVISGTSMGALLGAGYASGMSGRDIRAFALDVLSNRLNTLRRLFPGSPKTWTSVFALGKSAALEPERLMSLVLPKSIPDNFSDLKIPLKVVTADFYREEEFVIEAGPLRKAIGASAALPVFLAPVQWEDRILIDGGFVNPTPFDILAGQAAIIVAVDVTGNGRRATGDIPGALDTWIGSSQIALHSLVNERLKRIRPDVLVQPEVGVFATTEFHRIDDILDVADRVKEQVKRQLGDLLDAG